MKIVKVTKERYVLEDGRVFDFDEPLEHVPTPKQLQKMLEENEKYIEGLKNASDSN